MSIRRSGTAALLKLAAILLSLASLERSRAEIEQSCYDKASTCEFFFDGFEDIVPEYDICKSFPDDQYFTDAIRSRDVNLNAMHYELGTMNVNEPVKVLNGTSFVNITEIDSFLTASQFKITDVTGVPRVVYEALQFESPSSVIGQCFLMEMSAWQIRDHNGRVVGNINSPEEDGCIVFGIKCDE